MSAPDTDIEKQKRRHKAPLMGMKGVVILAVLLLAGFVFYTAVQTEDVDAGAVTDGVPTVSTTVDN
jgi:hypothetical protein